MLYKCKFVSAKEFTPNQHFTKPSPRYTEASLVKELSQFSALAQRTSKDLLNMAQDAPLHVGIKLEGEAYGRLRSSRDFREGVESFQAKRKPDFHGS